TGFPESPSSLGTCAPTVAMSASKPVPITTPSIFITATSRRSPGPTKETAMSMMRNALLMAAESPWLRERAPRYRFIRRTVERFLPGESLEEALAAAKRLADSGIDTLLTHLGEN